MSAGRIVLGATCLSDAEAALDIALFLAKEQHAELHAVLVEDQAVFAAIGTSQARVVSYAGRRMAPIGQAEITSAFRSEAAMLEARLSHAAAEAPVRWSFDKVRGGVSASIEAQAAGGDVIILGFPGAKALRSGIVLAVEGAPTPANVDLAGRLRARFGGPLTVLAPNQNLAAIAALLPSDAGAHTKFVDAPERSTRLTRLHALAPAAVVLDAPGARLRDGLAYVEAARAPVIFPQS